jgi:hypothetical protein
LQACQDCIALVSMMGRGRAASSCIRINQGGQSSRNS